MKPVLPFCLSLLACGAANSTHAADDVGKRWNILFIAVDDLKPLLGCYGYSPIHTPNIDRLAASGTVFRMNYCQMAISGPTRASLLTGLRPDHTGVYDLVTRMRDLHPDHCSLPEYLRSYGYETAGIGKIYDPRCVDDGHDYLSWSVPYGPVPEKYYAEGYASTLSNLYYQAPEAREDPAYKPSSECLDVPNDAYLDGAIANQAIDYMDRYFDRDKPVFLAVGFHRPHLPFVAPKRYWDLYDRDSLPMAAYKQKVRNGTDWAYHDCGELKNNYTDIPSVFTFSDVYNAVLPRWKEQELIHAYHACVSYTDALIGKLLDHLEATGHLDDTLIVLWGDHGWHLGDHGLWNKHTNFEQATAAPLIVRVPGQRPGVTRSLTEFTDVFPTVCDAVGLPLPSHLDGLSLMPLIENPQAQVHAYAVSQYRRTPDYRIMGYAIRDSRYRYVVWFDGYYRSTQPYDPARIVACELYDYLEDPDETESLHDEPSYAPVRKRMEAFLQDFIARMNESVR